MKHATALFMAISVLATTTTFGWQLDELVALTGTALLYSYLILIEQYAGYHE
jgi:hypothetical protein